jgi:hypothetical protein
MQNTPADGTKDGGTEDGVTPISTNDEERLEDVLQRMELDDEATDRMRTVLRLMVGGALIGWDELLTHLEQWEEEVSVPQTPRQTEAGTIVFVEPGSRTSPTLTESQELRYMLLGLLFESESRLHQRGSALLKFAGQTTDAFFSPMLRWADRSKRLRPVRSRFDDLVKRGEAVTDRWIQRGQVEESYSRRLVITATQDTFDSSMEQLGQAPELQNLVKMQSAGLSQEVLDEVRSRTVSGDLVAEGLVRRVLRRTPRRQLPGPADTVGLSQEEPEEQQD